MAKKEKNITLYKTPFSKAYWRDACAELKSIRMLMIAALLIAMRVALKGVAIPLGPTLKINTAIYVTGLGSMIFGPVIAVLGAMISDTLGCFLFPSGPYFFPFIFVEIAGSLIYALFFYRARISTTRVFLARFCICLFVNVIMNSMILEKVWRGSRLRLQSEDDQKTYRAAGGTVCHRCNLRRRLHDL